MAPKWIIVADDLTGAADCALEFVKGGASAEVILDHTREIAGSSAGVVAYTTESRGLSAADAGTALETVVGAALKASVAADTKVYKKVDSTLRGPVGAEIVATMRLVGTKVCIMAAASPDSGRTTIGGYALLQGVPIEHTAMAKDPLAPVKTSYVPDLFEGLGVQTIHVALRSFAEDAGTDLAATLEAACATATAAPDGSLTVVVCDGATQDHLDAVAEALEALEGNPLICGAQGLATAIAGSDGVWTRSPRVWTKVPPGPIVFSSTSHQKVTREQIKFLKEKYPIAKEFGPTAKPSETVNPGSIILLHTPSTAEAEFSGTVDRTVSVINGPVGAGGVVLGGGGLATAVLQKLGCAALDIRGEVDQNVPICRVVGGANEGLQVVTKAGALGDPEVFVTALKLLRSNFDLGPGVGRPILGITMGDPCGVGPEIIAKALSLPEIYKKYRPLVIGDPKFMEAGIKAISGFSTCVPKRVGSPEECKFEYGTIECWSNFEIQYDQIQTGVVGAEAGRCAAQWVVDAVELACADRIDAIVTAPINKEAIHAGGFKYNGHTELLAKFSGAKTSRLMLVANNLKVVHATAHVAFRKVSEQLSQPGRLETTIDMLHEFMIELGFDTPRIAVAGLNPHCGDGAIYGVTEETTVIGPCIEKCNKKAGYNIIGPVPGDTCFMKAVRGDFDAVVAMYHDEGHIPAKLMGFGDTVNVTLGLPIIRTSVDHGTAFDIAGKGIAHHSNLLTAMEFGAEMAIGRQQRRLAAKLAAEGGGATPAL